MILELLIDGAAMTCRFCVKQHPSEKAELTPVHGFDECEVTTVSHKLGIIAIAKIVKRLKWLTLD